MKIATFRFLLLFLICPSSGKQISTVFTANNINEATTGNGIFNKINFEWFVVHKDPKQQEVDKALQSEVERFTKLKNSLILDIPSEDSKIFSLQKDDYFYTSSKRGSLFQYIAIICIFFVFWVFFLRITKGNCGGYKTIIRKPAKETRHNRIKMISITSALFLCSGVAALVFLSRTAS